MARKLLNATGVEGIVGRWGAGKTLVLSALALEGFDDPKCVEVWATFDVTCSLTGKSTKYLDPDLIGEQLPALSLPVEDVRAGKYLLVLVDEAAVVMPSRLWDKMPVSFLVTLAQGRKRGVRLRWAAQSEKRVDTVLREVTTTVWKCGCFRPFGRRPWWVRMREYEPGETEMGDKAWDKAGRRQVRIRRLKRAMESYDTLQQVKASSHLTGDKPRGGAGGRAKPVTPPADTRTAPGPPLSPPVLPSLPSMGPPVALTGG